MIAIANPRELAVAERLYRLQQEAYTLEARLIGYSEFPPLRETLEELRQSADQFLVFIVQETVVGALSFLKENGIVTISRLIVSPRYLRCGIATALLNELENRVPEIGTFVVTTAQSNTPAVCLYQRMAYRHDAVSLSPEGISLIRFRKQKLQQDVSPDQHRD